MAVFELQQMGKLGYLISQNVDNLHLRSGIEPDLLAELHGNLTKLRCIRCDFHMDNFGDMTICPLCDGQMVSSVVDFGQSLPEKVLAEAYRQAQKCDLFIVLEASLVVTPAADIPYLAVEYGAKLVILNQGETPLDHLAGLRFDEDISEVFPEAIVSIFFGAKYPLVAPYLLKYTVAMAFFAIAFLLMNYFLSLNQTTISYLSLGAALAELGLIALFHADIAQIVNVMLISATVCLLLSLLPFIKRKVKESTSDELSRK